MLVNTQHEAGIGDNTRMKKGIESGLVVINEMAFYIFIQLPV